MKPPRLLAFLALFGFLALGPAAFGQTVRNLAYDTTNWTVIGWTNTNAIIFTNRVNYSNTVRVPNGALTNPSITFSTNTINPPGFYFSPLSSIGLAVTRQGSVIMGWRTNVIAIYAPITVVDGIGGDAATIRAATMSNLAGAATFTTNVQVLVTGGATNTLQFSNGILTGVTAP
jgi:hypothetical protein